jgi:hypothetical protein
LQETSLQPGEYLIFYVHDPSKFEFFGRDPAARSFFLTRESELLTRSVETQGYQVIKEPIVQQFIQASIDRQTIVTNDQAGEDVFGFFMAVPQTNLLLFSTLPVQRLFAPVLVTLYQAAGALLLGIIVMLILVRVMFAEIRDQVGSLVQLLNEFHSGLFIPPSAEGVVVFSEFKPLLDMVLIVTKRVRQRMNELERQLVTQESEDEIP